jgi:hypothetical protein
MVSSFPNFSASGSIAGMKRLYYGLNACLVRCGSYIYNVPLDVYDRAHAQAHADKVGKARRR